MLAWDLALCRSHCPFSISLQYHSKTQFSPVFLPSSGGTHQPCHPRRKIQATGRSTGPIAKPERRPSFRSFLTATISDSGRVQHGNTAKVRSRKVVLTGEMERVEVLPLHLHHHYGRDKQMTRVEKLPRYPKQRVEILPLRPLSLPIWPATRRPDKFCRSLAIRHFHTWIWPVEEPLRT